MEACWLLAFRSFSSRKITCFCLMMLLKLKCIKPTLELPPAQQFALCIASEGRLGKS
ncbi:hypothetical protein SAMN05518670_2862 [Paenibacillus sp. OK076]|nr:hypothetical protein SAMN05518670_2862 [Paenibacillus sp. OK076]